MGFPRTVRCNTKMPESSSLCMDAPKRGLSKAWHTFLALMIVATFSTYITISNFQVRFPLDTYYTGNFALSEAHAESTKRIERVCKRIQQGAYPPMTPMAYNGTITIQQGAYPKAPMTYNRNITRIHAIVDDYHKVVYCPIPKTGTTSWWGIIGKIVDREKQQRRRWFSQHPYHDDSHQGAGRYSALYEFGINVLLSGGGRREVSDDIPDPRTDYFKFIQVRHPLERLASAYADKVQGYNAKTKGRLIHMKKKLGNRTWKRRDKVSITEYLTYIASPDIELTHEGDVHWKTFNSQCDPCFIHYDHVAHLENLDSDLDVILPHFKSADLKKTFPELNRSNGKNSTYTTFYHGLAASVLKPVLDKYRADADMFGYTFDEYLEESDKHLLMSS